MDIFTSGLFWFIVGILFCTAAAAFNMWAKDRGIPMPFWKWIILLAWTLLFEFTIAFVTTSAGENEPGAAVKGGIFFGIITVVSGAGVWRILKIGKRQIEKQA